MKKYILDLTGANLPNHIKGTSLTIPVVPGAHCMDLDIKEDEVSPGDLSRWRDNAHRALARKHGDAYDTDARAESESMPIGFDIKSLPVGAIIRVEEVTP